WGQTPKRQIAQLNVGEFRGGTRIRLVDQFRSRDQIRLPMPNTASKKLESEPGAIATGCFFVLNLSLLRRTRSLSLPVLTSETSGLSVAHDAWRRRREKCNLQNSLNQIMKRRGIFGLLLLMILTLALTSQAQETKTAAERSIALRLQLLEVQA